MKKSTQEKLAHNKHVRARNLERQDEHDALRKHIAEFYLRGKGIEIGGLHKPLNVPEDRAIVTYVDRMSAQDLQLQYPEITEPMVAVDIIDNGETLKKVKAQSQDFLIACHFYEHCADPIQTMKNMLRVVKRGGGIFLALPDKRYTFDFTRPITSFNHIVQDHENGPEHTKLAHFKEWVKEVDKVTEKKAAKTRLDELLEMDYSIHYHVWDYDATVEHFVRVKNYLNDAFEIELIARNKSENILYLRKK